MGEFPFHANLREEEKLREDERTGETVVWHNERLKKKPRGGFGEGRSELAHTGCVHTVWKQQPFSPFQKHVFPSPGILLWHISLL